MRISFVISTVPSQGRVGGAELQCSLLAKGLAASGWDVTVIATKNIAQARSRVYSADNTPRSNKKPPGGDLSHFWHVLQPIDTALSVFRYRLRWLIVVLDFVRLFEKARPDIVLVTSVSWSSGLGGLWSLFRGRKLLYRAAHIKDADLASGRGTGWSEVGYARRCIHSLVVRNANAIVTNADYVAAQFKRSLPGKTVWAIRNGQEIGPVHRSQASHVLWMARFAKVKNPMMYVRLASKLPDVQFVMCGFGPLHNEIAKEASRVPNLSFMGYVGEETKKTLLGGAFAFVNTSRAEGFPNTLIESGIYMTPYVSFVDPDGVIGRYNLGFHVSSFSELVEKTALLVEDGELRKQMGANIRSYVEREHDIKDTVSSYDRLLRSI
jgi:glycosyltransferase involved in cell wall biosynthesis